MLNSENFIHISGIFISLIISVSVISYTSKFIFGADKIKKLTPGNQIYDPDYNLNISHICIFSNNIYSTTYENSPCYNKTMVQWYNPWLRDYYWSQLWNEIEMRKRIKEMEVTIKETVNETETLPPNETVVDSVVLNKDDSETRKLKEKPSEFVYAILVGLLIVSAMAACWEVVKEKMKRNEAAAAKTQDKQCTLANFTINRHLRRESQQQTASQLPRQASFEITPKVTQTLIHQSSLDRTFPKLNSEVVDSLEARRNSMPSYMTVNFQQHDKTLRRNVASTPSGSPFRTRKRQSVDVTGEETSLDVRKRLRHFIRRH